MPLFISCRCSCCGLRVRAFVRAGGCSASPSLPLCTFCCPLHHFHLSAPLFGSLSLFTEGRAALETTHRSEGPFYKTHRILLSTVVWKPPGRLALCLCKMTTYHHLCCRFFHHGRMKRCCFIRVIDWLVSLCFLDNIEFGACLRGVPLQHPRGKGPWQWPLKYFTLKQVSVCPKNEDCTDLIKQLLRKPDSRLVRNQQKCIHIIGTQCCITGHHTSVTCLNLEVLSALQYGILGIFFPVRAATCTSNLRPFN